MLRSVIVCIYLKTNSDDCDPQTDLFLGIILFPYLLVLDLFSSFAAGMFAYGQVYMTQIVRNAQTLGTALDRRGIPMLGAHKGYTTTYQAIADIRSFVGALQVAQQLAQANIIANKNLIPADRTEDWDRPGGLRIGTIEIKRLGMGKAEIEAIARILVERGKLEAERDDVIAFRQPYQTLYYCFENGFPVKA